MEIKMTHYCEYNRNKLSQNKFEINPKQANAETCMNTHFTNSEMFPI